MKEALLKRVQREVYFDEDGEPVMHRSPPQPKQEPVAWTLLLTGEHHGLVGKAGDKFVGHPEHYERVDVYTAPPQRKPLTVQEIAAFVGTHEYGPEQLKWFRLGEAAHDIKENT